MITTTPLLRIHYDSVMDAFTRLTGWGTTCLGIWNADFSKPVVIQVDSDGFYSREQDFAYFWGTGIKEDGDLDAMLKRAKKVEYKGHVYYKVYISRILQFLVNAGELPKDSEFVLTN